MSALRIGLIGNGKMGRMIDSICAQDERFAVAGFVGPGACQTLGELTDLDVALDFSYPGNVTMMLEDALRRAGLSAGVISTPRQVAIGCGLSVRFELSEYRQVMAVYRRLNPTALVGFYRVDDFGTRDIRLTPLM